MAGDPGPGIRDPGIRDPGIGDRGSVSDVSGCAGIRDPGLRIPDPYFAYFVSAWCHAATASGALTFPVVPTTAGFAFTMSVFRTAFP